MPERGGSESGGVHGSATSGTAVVNTAAPTAKAVEKEPKRSGGGEGGAESGEAAMSSPTIPLGQSWNGVLGGLAVSAQSDGATQSVHTTVQNTLSQTLCYVQAEPHLKSGTTTVGELGPDMLGDLNPGQQATSILAVASEPNLAGVAYDGYVVHMEVFDCAGPGPMPHTGGEGAEGSGGEGAESGEGNAEHGGAGAEGSESGGETGAATGEEGSGANTLALNETFDMVRSGARLILNYDAASNAFIGTVENTTNNVLDRVRIEVHLTNGTELGPTTPINLAPGEVAMIILPARAAAFDGWVAHAEVGGGGQGSEAGGEHGSDGGDAQGSESGGEGMKAEAARPAASTAIAASVRSWLEPIVQVVARANRIRPMEHSSGIISPGTYPVIDAAPHL